MVMKKYKVLAFVFLAALLTLSGPSSASSEENYGFENSYQEA
jgi:hypothetical protein